MPIASICTGSCNSILTGHKPSMQRPCTVQKVGWASGKAACAVSLKGIEALYQVAWGQSQARKQPPERNDPRIEAEILAIRDDPPEGLRRPPGPKAILYYLPQRQTLWESSLRLPTSTRTVYNILKRNRRIPLVRLPMGYGQDSCLQSQQAMPYRLLCNGVPTFRTSFWKSKLQADVHCRASLKLYLANTLGRPI
jgi:hypothetical protein